MGSNVCKDSRTLQRGDVFVAMAGTHADRQVHIAEAVARGASSVVVETPEILHCPVPVVSVPCTRTFWAEACAARFPKKPAFLVGVTGTNGKSSTVSFIRQLWALAGIFGASVGTLGTFEGDACEPDQGEAFLTTPDAHDLHQTLHMLAERGITHAALEVSSHSLDQKRAHALRFNAAVLTTFSQDHLDYHMTMDRYWHAKKRLFSELLDPAGVAVVSQEGKGVAWKYKTFTAGTDLSACVLEATLHGQRVALRRQNETVWSGWIPLVGRFQIDNLLKALLAVESGGVAWETLDLGRLRGVPGRMQRIGPVVVDYAHTPEGLETALQTLRPLTMGKVGVVFGCGGDRDASKRSTMGDVAAKNADWTIVTDDNPRTENPATVRAQICGNHAFETIADRAQAIATGIARLGSHDVLLVAGKGCESTQTIGKEASPFHDASVVRAILGLENTAHSE